MKDRVCVVTGANSGIGRATAEQLARSGARVILVSRNRDKGEAALREVKEKSGNANVELVLADLASQTSIRRLAEDLNEKLDHLDVLVNNAGVLPSKRVLTEDGLEMTFAVNHLAYFLLTNLLLPLLEKSAPARIVNVASRAHSSGVIDFTDLQSERSFSTWRAYAQSKLANILFTYELARRLEGTGVTANCLHPGVIATSLFHNLPKPVSFFLQLFLTSPAKGAETSVYLASSPEVEKVTGRYFVKKAEARSSEQSYDKEAARKLWLVSSQLTGLDDMATSGR